MFLNALFNVSEPSKLQVLEDKGKNFLTACETNESLFMWLLTHLSNECAQAALVVAKGNHQRPEKLASELATTFFQPEWQKIDSISGNLSGVLEGLSSLTSLMMATNFTGDAGKAHMQSLRGFIERVIFVKTLEAQGIPTENAIQMMIATMGPLPK